MTEPAPVIDEAKLAELAEQRRHELDDEYGQYVATQDIHFDGVLAYTKGARVPASNVALHGYLDSEQVEPVQKDEPKKPASKAAKAASTEK